MRIAPTALFRNALCADRENQIQTREEVFSVSAHGFVQAAMIQSSFVSHVGMVTRPMP